MPNVAVKQVDRGATTHRDRDRARIARARPACGICGQPIDYTLPYLHPREYVVDHIIPRSKGGSDDLSNKQAAHRDCNRDKSDKPYGRIIRRSGTLA